MRCLNGASFTKPQSANHMNLMRMCKVQKQLNSHCGMRQHKRRLFNVGGCVTRSDRINPIHELEQFFNCVTE